jgi:hypothetical protein
MAGLFVPGFMTAARLLSGDAPLPLGDMLGQTLMAAAFGAVAAGGSLKLAQRAQSLLSGGSQDQPSHLASGEGWLHLSAWEER